MKKRGFTIIELVVAAGIIIMGITAYGLVSSGAMKSYKANRIKISNLNSADTIVNVFKANGKLLPKNIFDNNTKDVNGNVSYYLYYDSSDELESKLNASEPITSNQIGTFTSCSSANSSNKQNGAFISISKINTIAGYPIYDSGNSDNNYNINMYGVFIKTWNFEYGESSEVKLKIYLSR